MQTVQYVFLLCAFNVYDIDTLIDNFYPVFLLIFIKSLLLVIWAYVQYVDKEFGTGVLKISPGHDHNDYHLARKLGLPILNVMNKDGTLNEVAGIYR